MPKKTRPYGAPQGFDWIVRVKEWQAENDSLRVSLLTAAGKEATIHFRAESATIWRITFFPPGVPAEGREPLIAVPVLTPLPLEIERTASGLLVRGAELTLEIGFRPWHMRFLNAAGSEVFGENPGDIDGLGRSFILPLGFVRRKGRTASVTASFKLCPGERLFGLGEKFTALDKSGQRIISWTQDALGSTSARSHKNIPFLWSNRGYGLYIDSGARIAWDLGATSCQSATIQVEDAALDAYLISGDAPVLILDHYASLTGRAPVPPKWSFGVWVSTGGTHRTQEEAQKLISGLERNEIPADVIHIDTWWMRERRYCDFQWDRKAFPRPEVLIETLHRRGLKLSLWEHPYISVESELFAVGKEKGYFVKRPDGDVYIIDYGLSLAPKPNGVVRRASPDESWNAPTAIIDLTHPEASAWFKDLHRPLLRQGVDSFKTDFGEDIPVDALFANGKTGSEMHNVYPLLYNRAVFEVIQEERDRGMVWARSAFAGSQRFPLVWSGDPAADFQSLAATIRGGLSAGLSGLPFWSNDIGGYRGMPPAELYVRWAQFGLFCSHSRMHGDSPREPWHFGEDAMSIVRKYALLRYELFPYIYSAAIEAGLKGLPVIRALPLVFPDDPNVRDKDFQYMFGPGILVAPVIEPGGKHSVYLPEGRWFDYWTGEEFEGPRNLKLEVPLDVLPLYIRGGAIIPKMQRAWRIPEEQIDPLIVEIWPHESSTYHLYEDEGVTEFRCNQGRDGLDFQWSGPLPRRIILHFKPIKKPRQVVLIPKEEPDRAYELEGISLEKTYVLAVPETAGALVTLQT
ncbi:MAG: TIM-barrel domain-containing protein [Candidatus Aminicenantales bacterium]